MLDSVASIPACPEGPVVSAGHVERLRHPEEQLCTAPHSQRPLHQGSAAPFVQGSEQMYGPDFQIQRIHLHRPNYALTASYFQCNFV